MAAPAWGVMGMAVRDEAVEYTRESNDFYVMAPWSEGQPWGVDVWGVLDQLVHLNVVPQSTPLSSLSPDLLIKNGVKFGRSIRTSDWMEVQKWMHDDPDFGPKSTRWSRERP